MFRVGLFKTLWVTLLFLCRSTLGQLSNTNLSQHRMHNFVYCYTVGKVFLIFTGPDPGCAGPKADPEGRGSSTFHGHRLLQI